MVPIGASSKEENPAPLVLEVGLEKEMVRRVEQLACVVNDVQELNAVIP